MKRIGSLCFTILLLLCLNVHLSQTGWVPTLLEDFNNQNSLNLNIWTPAYTFSPTVINSETQYYVPDAFSFTDSTMKINVERRPNYIPNNVQGTTGFNYTSGVITTAKKWSQTYGYFEMRARMPYGLGFWPAFWLLPNYPNSPRPFEIDVMEIVTDMATTLFTTYHCDYNGTNPLNTGFRPKYPSLTDTNFHSFGLQWVPGAFHFYFDRKYFWTYNTTCVSNTPSFLLANVAMGGWPLPPNNETVFPNYMEIDFIRAYSYSSTAVLSLGGDVGLGQAPGPVTIGAWNPTGPFTTCTMVVLPPSPIVSEVSPGANLTFTFNMTCSAAYNGIIQLWLDTYKLINSSTAAYAEGRFVTTGPGSVVTTASIIVPATIVPGHYSARMQAVSSPNYSPLFYVGVIGMVGVGPGYTVGHKPAPAASPSSSSIPTASNSISATGSTSPRPPSPTSSSTGEVFTITIALEGNPNIVTVADVLYALSQATGVPSSKMTTLSFNARTAVIEAMGLSNAEKTTLGTVTTWVGSYNSIVGGEVVSGDVQVRSSGATSASASGSVAGASGSGSGSRSMSNSMSRSMSNSPKSASVSATSGLTATASPSLTGTPMTESASTMASLSSDPSSGSSNGGSYVETTTTGGAGSKMSSWLF